MTVDVDALLADSAMHSGGRCATCAWLDSRPADEAEKWRAALGDDSFQASQIARAMERAASPSPGQQSVSNHRNGHSRGRK